MPLPNTFRESAYCAKCAHCNDCGTPFICAKHNFSINGDPYQFTCDNFVESDEFIETQEQLTKLIVEKNLEFPEAEAIRARLLENANRDYQLTKAYLDAIAKSSFFPRFTVYQKM